MSAHEPPATNPSEIEALIFRLKQSNLSESDTKYEQAVLRCSACQERYTAPLPIGVRPEKYAASCDVAIALAKYSAAMLFHRLAKMQKAFGVPLPESVQFERVEHVADTVLPVYLHLRSLAARG